MRYVRREIDVEDDEIWPVSTNTTDRRGAVHGGANFVARGFEFYRKSFQYHDVVVGHEDFRDMRPHWLRRGFRSQRQKRSGRDRGVGRAWRYEIHTEGFRLGPGILQIRVDPTRLGFFSEAFHRKR